MTSGKQINEMQSPSVDYDITPISTLEEQFYSDTAATKLKKMYKSRENLLCTILSMTKFISTSTAKHVHKTLVKSKATKDMIHLNESLTSFILNQQDEITSIQDYGLIVQEKLKLLPVLIDFCYVYYVHSFDDNAPFHKLPMTVAKLRMILSALHAYGNHYAQVNSIFELIIENQILTDMRIETPPYYMRTDLTDKEIEEKLNLLVIPAIKDLLKELIYLDPKKKDITADIQPL
jgi:hypothetical protein